MVSVDKAQIVKYRVNDQHFEILVDSDLAMQMRRGKSVSINDVLAINKIYKDSKKGLEVSPAALMAVFSTDNPAEVAKIIIQKGDIPLTADYKNKIREEKKKQVISYIHRYAVDPKTHLPHPITRLENAFEEAKVHIDENHDINKLIEEARKKLITVLPLKFEMKEIAIRIPSDYAAKSYGIVQSLGKILKNEWMGDGSWSVVIEIPGGMEEEMHDKLNSMCHGNVETKILKTR